MSRGRLGMSFPRCAGALACAIAALVVTGGPALAVAGQGGGAGRAATAPKGDEPGRGAGGTEHDEGCAPGHDTDRAVDDGHGCHQGTAPAAVTGGAAASSSAAHASTVAGASSVVAPAAPTGHAVVAGVDLGPAVGRVGADSVVGATRLVGAASLVGATDAAVRGGGSLAFTGARVAMIALIGLTLIALGVLARRLGAIGHDRPVALS